MPIQVACASCAGKFRVPDNVAGKKIRCPKCKEVIQIPAAGAAAAPTPPTDSPTTPKPTATRSQPKPTPAKPAAPATPTAPNATQPQKPALENWFLKTEDGESYGPVPRAALAAWYAEGRVTIDCQVLREGSDQWQWASELYPELDPESAAKVVPATPDVAAAPAEAPAPEPAKAEAPQKAAAKSSPAPSKPTVAPTPEPEDPEAAPSFFAAEEPASTAPEAADDNPFGFLGGGGDSGGGESFNFNSAPATSSASPAKASAKTAKKTPAPAAAAIAEASADTADVSDKSKLTAGLLAIFLGSLGVHRFYLGYTLLGVVQLLLCGGCGIWQIIDIVLIFTGKLPDAKGRPLKG